MDRLEYKAKIEEIQKLIKGGDTKKALERLSEENWKKVPNVNILLQAAELSDKFFSVVAGKLKGTGDLVLEIKSSMEEQREGSKQINEALRTMNTSQSDVQDASKEMESKNATILGEMSSLREPSALMQESMDEMSEGAQKVEESGGKLLGISQDVHAAINKIGSQIDLFKV